MVTITIKVDERDKAGMAFLTYVRTLSFVEEIPAPTATARSGKKKRAGKADILKLSESVNRSMHRKYVKPILDDSRNG
jgi:hypothetical protein